MPKNNFKNLLERTGKEFDEFAEDLVIEFIDDCEGDEYNLYLKNIDMGYEDIKKFLKKSMLKAREVALEELKKEILKDFPKDSKIEATGANMLYFFRKIKFLQEKSNEKY